jgi:hypothetical protein
LLQCIPRKPPRPGRSELKINGPGGCPISMIILLNFSYLNILTNPAIRAYDACISILRMLTEYLNFKG